MNSVNNIRSVFLNYFEKAGHLKLPSSSLVPYQDPTLLFTNAGMVPFKNIFTGLEKPKSPTATTAQKCVRAGGKHNDLDNVGYTARHHTFFEMLGNFSFGDYFKEEAIYHCWTLLTKEFNLPKDKLLVTVYHTDEEAAAYWKKIAGFSDDRIIKIATNDNFWSMGDVGPCGPCSEVFYDHGDKIWGGPPGSAEEDGDRFIEIWNLVFMQFEKTASGEMLALPKPSIDTGMGLERISAVLQGVHDNYDIDLFQNLIKASVEVSGTDLGENRLVSHRVIVDHLRSASFLIADGVLPSNEGRGYVLRRIMRRAMRHINLLGVKDSMMWRLVPALVKEMGGFYSELQANESLISETLLAEENRFRHTLDRGLLLLEEASGDLTSGQALSGEVAFKLYDTYGFPLDLTQDILRKRDISVDVDGFEAAMQKQKQEARAHWVGSGDKGSDKLWFKLTEDYGDTDFCGYDHIHSSSVIKAIVANDDLLDSADAGKDVAIIAPVSCFYAESGGQVGDKGIISGDNFVFEVSNTQRHAGLIVHYGKVISGVVTKGAAAEFVVDSEHRIRTARNHSATHLLHSALRKILGSHVMQKGSLVSADRLRFDFSHHKALSEQELQELSNLINDQILNNTLVDVELMDKDAAVDKGAMALFSEKYGDLVRVVTIDKQLNEDKEAAFSVELCGGTHVRRTGDIGLFHILSDSAVSSGVRRIEALTGDKAREWLMLRESYAEEAAALLKTKVPHIVDSLSNLLLEKKNLEKEVSQLRKKVALSNSGDQNSAADEVENFAGVSLLAKVVNGVAAKDLKSFVDAGKDKIKSGIVVFIAVDDSNRASVVVGATADVAERFSAVTLVRAASEALGGKGGGGRADMAQGGGPDGQNAAKAIAVIRDILKG